MVKLPHLFRITYNLQNQDSPNRFGVMNIRFQVAVFQNYLSMCNRPERRMTLRRIPFGVQARKPIWARTRKL